MRKASKKQKAEWDLQRAAKGATQDRLSLTVAPRGRAPKTIGGSAESSVIEVDHRFPFQVEGHKAQDLVQALRDRIASVLEKTVEQLEVDEKGVFTFPFGSTRIFVDVERTQDGPATVSISAITNIDVAPSPDLFQFVALNADNWLFGHLSAHQDSEGRTFVTFVHRLMGDFLDPAELHWVIGAVATTADQIDDVIQERFGGRLFHGPPALDEVPERQEKEPSTGLYL